MRKKPPLSTKVPALLLSGDSYILRMSAPAVTVGGGIVLDPFPPRRRRRSSDALGLLEAFFRRQQRWFQWQRPRAGSTTFPAFLGGDAQAFCDRLVAETGIMLVPGSCFDLEAPYLRFGYGRADLPEVLPLLEAYLERLAGRA